jgi:hypothetical protein
MPPPPSHKASASEEYDRLVRSTISVQADTIGRVEVSLEEGKDSIEAWRTKLGEDGGIFHVPECASVEPRSTRSSTLSVAGAARDSERPASKMLAGLKQNGEGFLRNKAFSAAVQEDARTIYMAVIQSVSRTLPGWLGTRCQEATQALSGTKDVNNLNSKEFLKHLDRRVLLTAIPGREGGACEGRGGPVLSAARILLGVRESLLANPTPKPRLV